jgi:inner membrane protein
MDFILHAIVGFFLGTLFQDSSGYILLSFVIASVLPDVDLIFAAKGRLSFYEHHRKFTHSIAGIMTLSLVAGFFFSKLFGIEFQKALLISLLSMIVHISLDLTNHCGTEIMYPFVKKRYSLEFTNVVEVQLYGIYSVCFILLFFFDKRAVASLAMVFSAVYLFFKAALHRIATNYAKQKFGKSKALPHFWNIFRWHIIHEESKKYILSDLDLLSGTIKRAREFKKAPDDMRDLDKKVHAFFDFAMYPIVQFEKDRIKLQDLRFFATNHFMLILKTDSGHVIDEKFRN